MGVLGKIAEVLIPQTVKQKLYDGAYEEVRRRKAQENELIPKVDLEEKHVKNTRYIADRFKLLELLPKNAVVAELGVDQGEFSEKIIEICEPAKFHLIDVWASEVYHQGKRKLVEDKFSNAISSGKMELNLGYSTDVVSQFQDAYFDWIYLDTDHTYAVTMAELEAYRSKVKPGGVIAGHDYIVGNWQRMVRYGVVEAVHEFCIKHDWELIYVTAELQNFPSFAIRKL